MARLTTNLKGTAVLALADGATRYPVILDNRMRTDRLRVRVRGTLTIAVAAAGAIRNGGDISVAVQHALNANGDDVFGVARGAMLRFRSAYRAGQNTGVTRLGDGLTAAQQAAVPIGVYPLESVYEINFSDRANVIPGETAFMESDPSSFVQLDNILNANGALSLVGLGGGGATAVLSAVTVQVEQVSCPAAGNALPVFRPRYRELSQVVPGANAQDTFYIKSAQRVAELIIAAETTLADGGTVFSAAVINSLRLIGDGGANIIGPGLSAFSVLVDSMKFLTGGDLMFESSTGAAVPRAQLKAMYMADFAQYGRLKDTIVPQRMFPNFRIEANDQPDPAATTSRIIVGLTELVRPDEENGWPVVTPELPAWLTGGV